MNNKKLLIYQILILCKLLCGYYPAAIMQIQANWFLRLKIRWHRGLIIDSGGLFGNWSHGRRFEYHGPPKKCYKIRASTGIKHVLTVARRSTACWPRPRARVCFSRNCRKLYITRLGRTRAPHAREWATYVSTLLTRNRGHDVWLAERSRRPPDLESPRIQPWFM